MGLRVRSGYLLTMDLNRAYKVCRDFRAFSWEVTQKVMARLNRQGMQQLTAVPSVAPLWA